MKLKPIEVGKLIKNTRKKKKITQEQLATQINKSTRMLQKYESGIVIPSFTVLNKISIALDTPIEQLMYVDMDALKNQIEENLKQLDPKVIKNKLKQNLDQMEKDIENLKSLAPGEQNLIWLYRQLNEVGQKEAFKRITELTEILRYTTSKDLKGVD